ncbi:MAG: putative signal transducing protein [bacterium]
MEELVLLKRAPNKAEAEIIKSYLESNGIYVFLKSSTVPYGDGPVMGMGGPVEIWVPEISIESAIELLEKRESYKGGGIEDDSTKG